MRILLVGATGTIGQAVADALAPRHEVLLAGRSKAPIKVDITSIEAIKNLYASVGKVDAVISTAGQARFKPFAQLEDDDYAFSITNKLMCQVNLVRYGMDYVNDGGSFTLTSGILGVKPMIGSGAISLVNAGLEGFTRAAALEAPRGIRVNIIAPPWVTETLKAYGMPLDGGMLAADVAKAYVKAAEGTMTAQTIAP